MRQDDARAYGGPRSRYAYFSFDDEVALASGDGRPGGIRRATSPSGPSSTRSSGYRGSFAASRRQSIARRVPGRFLLTGSANVLLLPALADSLAGRMEHPPSPPARAVRARRSRAALPRSAVRRRTSSRAGTTRRARRSPSASSPAVTPRRSRDPLHAGGARGIGITSRRSSNAMFANSHESLRSTHCRGLLALAAGQTARLINVTDLASPFQLSRPTIRDYVTLLERVFLIDELPPWHSNRLSRLIKTPKLHVGDTGLACALLGLDTAALMRDRGDARAVAGDLRVPGTSPAGELARRRDPILTTSRQGRRRSGHRAGAWRGTQSPASR